MRLATKTALFDDGESWEEHVKRLAMQLRDARPDPFTSSPNQRQLYRRLRNEMQRVIEEVPEL